LKDLAMAYAAKRRKVSGAQPSAESTEVAPMENQDMNLFDQLEQQTELPSEGPEEVVESQEQSPLDNIMRRLRMSKMRG